MNIKFQKTTNLKKQQISKNNRFWFCFIPPIQVLHNLLADRPDPAERRGVQGGDLPAKAKIRLLKYFFKKGDYYFLYCSCFMG